MEEIDSFSLGKLSDTDSELILEQSFCNRKVPGVSIEKQYRLDSKYFLILTSDDCPYEECLHITLLDDSTEFVDLLDIGFQYGPGVLDNIVPISDDTLEFDFYSGVTYRLSIDTSGTRFNFVSSLPEVSYHHSILRKRFLRMAKIKNENKGSSNVAR
jgi:hypothetical protein